MAVCLAVFFVPFAMASPQAQVSPGGGELDPERMVIATEDAVLAVEMLEEGLVTADTIVVTRLEPEEFQKHFRLSTNGIGWLMLQANVGFEFDMAQHWSFQLPIYYCGVNYFTNTWKFRIFSFQPEFRYWLREDNMGVFFGAHLGIAWYDFAFGGEYRYQDQHRNSPAIGGGLAAGYRMPMTSDGRWNVAFEIGLGVYHLNYDRIHNVENGRPFDQWSGMKFLVDRLAVSFSYSFNL